MSNNGKLSFGHINGAHDDFLDALMLANYSRVQFMERKPMSIQGRQTNRNIRPSFGGLPT
jgi:hypothetical protein